MKDKMKKTLLKNKDDLIEGTFCYLLFEEGFFDVHLMEALIQDASEYMTLVNNDSDIKELLVWISQCVEQCFSSHHDKDDLFIIKNYTSEIENKWMTSWKIKIQNIIKEV